MFCRNCGNEIKNGEDYCLKCGKKTRDDVLSGAKDLLTSNNAKSFYKEFKKVSKRVFLGFLALLLIGLGIWGAIELRGNALKKKVDIRIVYIPKECPEEFPLSITVTNNSNKTLESVSYGLGIRRIGYSTDISSFSSLRGTDKILAPGEVAHLCSKYQLQYGYDYYLDKPDQLEYFVTYKNPEFQ